jgi:PAS domain S-box-containing protein
LKLKLRDNSGLKPMDNPRTSDGKLSDLQLLLSILDSLPTSIFVKDQDLKFVYNNSVNCELMGRTSEELLGTTDADVFSSELSSQLMIRDRKVLESGVVEETEEAFPLESGGSRIVMTRKARLQGADGKTYLIGTNSDLTEIRQREDQYKVLTETVPVGIVQVNEDGELVFCNPLFIAYCGGDVSGSNGRHVIEKIKESNPHFPGQACRFETDIQGLGGEPRAVIVLSSGWLRIGSEKKSAIISVIDISAMTELRRVNAEISRLNRELAENMRKLKDAQDELVKKGKMEQLGQLTATVAHELRNPLGAVRTSAYLLERKLQGQNLGVEAQFQRINNGIDRCDNTITQLLDFSRSKNLACVPGNIDQWLADVVQNEALELPASVEITLSLGLNDAMVPFDPARLQRAVVNLMANASEALQGNGRDVRADQRICITTARSSSGIAISFKDNGPGMGHEILARVREPLFTTKSFGTGLGIPAVEQIAMQHGGRLDIESVPGEGSTFTVWLPGQEESKVA